MFSADGRHFHQQRWQSSKTSSITTHPWCQSSSLRPYPQVPVGSLQWLYSSYSFLEEGARTFPHSFMPFMPSRRRWFPHSGNIIHLGCPKSSGQPSLVLFPCTEEMVRLNKIEDSWLLQVKVNSLNCSSTSQQESAYTQIFYLIFTWKSICMKHCFSG